MSNDLTCIGIDPGFDGGLAVVRYSDGVFAVASSAKMPVHKLDGGRMLDYPAVYALFEAWIGDFKPVSAWLEEIPDGWTEDGESAQEFQPYLGIYPFLRQRAASMKLAKQFGALEAILSSCVTYHTVMPRVWQTAMGVRGSERGSTKESARDIILQDFGETSYRVHCEGARGSYLDGIGDAILIARYGLSSELGIFD